MQALAASRSHMRPLIRVIQSAPAQESARCRKCFSTQHSTDPTAAAHSGGHAQATPPKINVAKTLRRKAAIEQAAVLQPMYRGPFAGPLTTLKRSQCCSYSTSTTAAATDAVSTVVVPPGLTVDVAAQLQAETDATEAQNARVFVAERMSILGRKKHTVFALKDVVPQSDASRRPFVSFQTLDSDTAAQQQQQRKTD
eukprot:1915-Heterococcus_DN1.PRE.2